MENKGKLLFGVAKIVRWNPEAIEKFELESIIDWFQIKKTNLICHPLIPQP